MDDFFKLLGTLLRIFEVNQSPQAFLVLVGLAFARLASFLHIAPFFGGSAVSARIKVATAIALIIVVYPMLAAGLGPGGVPLPFGVVGYIALLVKESLVGLALGFLVSLIFQAIQMSGRLIDTARGSHADAVLAPQLQTRVSETGQFKFQLALVLFLTTGAHRPFLDGLMQSFQIIPVLGFPRFAAGWSPQAEFIVNFIGRMLIISIQLAMPVIIGALLTDFFFGLLNRAGPQINVFFLSMPVKSALGLLIVLLTLRGYQEWYQRYFGETYQAFIYLMKYMGAAL
jgi:flagellar biosynthetic protein FliR